MPELSCSSHFAYIQGKCNGPRLCELEGATRIYYERKLDEVSEAEVEIGIDGDVSSPCCLCLGDVEPWCHVLTIVREGEGVVWTGPVQEVTYTFDKTTIRAKDNLAWLQKRAIEGDITYINNTTVELTQIALDIIETAMADEDSACVLDCIIDMGDGLPAGALRDVDYPAFSEPTAYDYLVNLAESGLNFTVYRNCIVLGGEKNPEAPIGVLTDEMILGGNVQVRKDGDLQANAVYIRYTGDDDPDVCADAGLVPPCPAYVESAQECYGLLEQVIPSNLLIPDADMAEEVGQRYLAGSRLTPRILEFPPGTRISSDVPWSFDSMIPGQRIDVALSKLCLPVFQSFKLVKVTVTDTADNEEIAIDLATLDEVGPLE